MKLFPLLIITFIYLIILTLYNFSLYKLLTNEEFGHQFYLILIYFLCEIFSFFHYFCSYKDIIIGDISPYIESTEMSGFLSISEISNNNNININLSNFGNNSDISNIRKNSDNSNITINSNNNISSDETSESDIETVPFIGIKSISFIITGFLDFLSKMFIYNGIKYMYQDSILRCLIEMLIVSFGSLIILKLKNTYVYYSLIGLSMIILYLIFFIISHKVKANSIGILILSEGGILNSIQYLIHSHFFIKGERYIYRIIAWEGLFGSIFSFIFLIIASIITCPFEPNDKNNDFAFKSFCNGITFEDSLITFFSNIKNNLVWFFIYLISCIFYSFLGVFIIRYVNVIYRVSLDSFRMLFFIIIVLIISK